MSATFRVIIKGVKDGFTEEQVLPKLSALFKSSEEQARKILLAESYPIKKGVDQQTAIKYQAAIQATGASVVVELEVQEVTNLSYCTKCGAGIAPDAEFCGKCGAKIGVLDTPEIKTISPSPPLHKITEYVPDATVKRRININDLSLIDTSKAILIVLIVCSIFVAVYIKFEGSFSSEYSGGSVSQQKILDEIWANYMQASGANGSGERYLDLHGSLLKKGSVPPNTLNSSVEGRLPAYLACYDYIFVLPGLGDSKQGMCVFYISNPARGTVGVKWRGKQYLGDIEQIMAQNGFVEDSK